MVGFRWHIVTALFFLCLVTEGFPQSFDSIPATSGVSDTLSLSNQAALDSIRQSTAKVRNSLQLTYDSITDTATALKTRVTRGIDSLKTLGINTDRYTQSLDSLTVRNNARADSLTELLDNLRNSVNGKLAQLDLPPEVAEQTATWLSPLNETLDVQTEARLSSIASGINPTLDISEIGGHDIDQTIPGGPNINTISPLPEIPSTTLSFGSIGDLADPLAPTELEQIPIQQPVAGVIPADKESAAAMIEQRAMQVPETAGVIPQLDQYASLNSMPEDLPAMKEALIDDGKRIAVNHFAGKEEHLQQAMDRLSVLKKKYHSFESILDLPKKAPNPMREKSFVERLLPGIALQVGRDQHWLLDVNAYVGYRLTHRITAGTGWNQRVAYSSEANRFNSAPVIYGPRVYGEYNIGKGFSPRLELEYMNTHVPAQFASNPDNPNIREWVFGVMAGMKKEYNITRRLKGTALLMYNMYDPHHRSPYRNRLNGRFGVEMPINEKKIRNQ